MFVVGEFYKVSFDQFAKDFHLFYDDDMLKGYSPGEIYDAITLPKRSTSGSAGYDILAPFDFHVDFGDSIVIPTGLRCRLMESWFLDINPRSGHGFKYGIRLANTRGIIDTDYYGADNEGHIMIKISNNDGAVNKFQSSFVVEKGKAFCQGILSPYGVTVSDSSAAKRTGGFGSTGA